RQREKKHQMERIKAVTAMAPKPERPRWDGGPGVPPKRPPRLIWPAPECPRVWFCVQLHAIRAQPRRERNRVGLRVDKQADPDAARLHAVDDRRQPISRWPHAPTGLAGDPAWAHRHKGALIRAHFENEIDPFFPGIALDVVFDIGTPALERPGDPANVVWGDVTTIRPRMDGNPGRPCVQTGLNGVEHSRDLSAAG